MNVALFQEIQRYIQLYKWNKTDLSKKSGIHISEISRILNHRQTLSLQHLDAITKAFGLTEGTLYPYYVEECLNEGNHVDKRRGIQFLYKCAAEGHEKHCNDLITLMLEENSMTIRKKNLSYIFSVAEQLFLSGKEQQALPLYEIFIDSELNRFSEKVAVSYFRKFYIVRLTDRGQHALTHLLDQLAYMPTDIRKEAYMWIMADYYRREDWRQVLNYAEKLIRLATEGEYYGRALMYKGFALTRLGASLEEVLDLIEQYAQVNEFFADTAIGNRYVALLEYGQLEHVDEYLFWLEDRKDMYVGLPRILDSYVRLERLDDAKRLIERYKHVIDDISVSKGPWLKGKMYLDFRCAYALLLCKCHQFDEGLLELVEVAELSNRIGNMERFKKCLLTFWQYRLYASSQHEEKYTQLLSAGISKLNMVD
ncbi:helix-turn-helix domain-containing protein [Sutcliffiella halmapala]|uniref:helix-turn-helix domain-containing protein n=1 Tax=Sutcliffiella halmapala TaxID=79882 RepID=UPI000995B68E|nr:helix-turn-helix transcriptional regulator [Sutcliffiella halmapala]